MERLRHHFLARAALAQNQHWGAGGGHLANEVEDGLHRWTCAEHVLEAVGPHGVLQGAVLLLEFCHIYATLQHEPEFVHVDRLTEEVVGAGPDGADGVLLVVLTGDDDHLGQQVQRENRREYREALLGFMGAGRQSQIEQGHRGTNGGERG